MTPGTNVSIFLFQHKYKTFCNDWPEIKSDELEEVKTESIMQDHLSSRRHFY